MKNKYSDIQNTNDNIDYASDWRKREFSHPERTIHLATAFSGVGAIEHAFDRLGLKTIIEFAGDIDANCKKSYFANYKIDESRWFSDIHNFSALPYKGKIDLLVGGSPCQSFSTVGYQRGFDDTRGTLFREYARVIKECEPKVFIYENVHGLFTHDKGVTWEVIRKTFEDYCDYDVYFQCLNAKDYGIPQRRERLFCIGFKKESYFKYPRPIPLEYRMYDFLEDYRNTPYYDAKTDTKYITDDFARISLGASFRPRFNEFVFKCNEVADKYYISEKVAKYVLSSGTKAFKTQVGTDCDIARTLLSSMHKMHRSGVDNYVTYKKEKGIDGLRKLTPRECFRLMGFSDDFKIVVSDTSAYQQAGNSIVVDVFIAILKQLDITRFAEPSNSEIKPKQNSKENIDWNGESWVTRSFAYPNRTIRIGTSFSGIGAIEHAFKRLGLQHEIMFAGDIDDYCKKAYMANYKLPEKAWHNDIYKFDATPFRDKIDLFVGGAPCQAFSMRGKRGGFEDTRGTLFREFARVVLECRPKVFIFENVKGMFNHDRGNTWQVIKDTFEKSCGYDVHYQILNGKNYGIPQSRERIFCIGFREENNDFLYPAPIELTKKKYDYLEKEIDSKYFLPVKGFKFITSHVNKEKMYTNINGDVILCQKRNQQFNWHGDFVFHPFIPRLNSMDDISRVFNISEGEESYYVDDALGKYAIKSAGKGRFIINPVEMSESPSKGWFRKLTPRECLRLMGFDDSFKIVVPDSETYKQAGNSIIVDIFIALLKQLDITKYGDAR